MKINLSIQNDNQQAILASAITLQCKEYSLVQQGMDVCITDQKSVVGKYKTAPVHVFFLNRSEAADDQELPAKQDILTVPFRLGRLIDRLHVYYRHLQDNLKGPPISIGGFEFVPVNLTVEHHGSGKAHKLTEKERDILLYLYQNKGETIGRDILLDEIWGYADGVDTHTLETHIYRLRQKIETDPANPDHIVTKDGGYVLVC